MCENSLGDLEASAQLQAIAARAARVSRIAQKMDSLSAGIAVEEIKAFNLCFSA